MSVSLEQRSDANYALKLDQVTASVAYIGEAQIATPTSSPNWCIRKLGNWLSLLMIRWL